MRASYKDGTVTVMSIVFLLLIAVILLYGVQQAAAEGLLTPAWLQPYIDYANQP